MWDDQVRPKTTKKIQRKCFLMTSRFGEIYRDCWYNSDCPPSGPKSPTRMQTAVPQTGAKYGKVWEAEISSNWLNPVD